jgi:hypothetical protein
MEGMSLGGVASDWYRALYSNPPLTGGQHTHIPPSIPPRRHHTEGGEGVNLQPASRVVTRGLSAATSGVGVAIRGGRGPSIIYQSDDLPPLPPPGEDDEDDDDVRPYFCASREGEAWAAPLQTQVV